MHIEMTPENLLIQLSYPVKQSTLEQMQRIMQNTKNFDNFSKHIISLNDEVKRFAGVVTVSNTKDYLKIKTDSSSPKEIEAFEEVINSWSKKYKVKLQKVDGKNTYYILGQI